MMRRIVAATIFLAGFASSAHATEWVTCSNGDGKVSFDVLLGLMDVIAIDTINIEAGGKKWSTKTESGTTPISVGQAFESPEQMLIDVLGEGRGPIVAQLRLFKAHDDGPEGGEPFDATGGTLRMPGIGAWAVSCSGP